MNWPRKLADALAAAGAVVAGLSLVVMTGFILMEIVLRTFFRTSSFMVELVVGYGVAVMTFGAMGFALRNGAMIRVNLLTERLGKTAHWLVEMAVTAVTAGLIAFLMRDLAIDIQRNLARGATTDSMVQIPLWVPSSILFCGLAILLAQLVARFLDLAMTRRIPSEHERTEF